MPEVTPTPNLSLAELEALNNKTDIASGDGNKTAADLEVERQKQAQEAADKLKQQQSQQKTPEQLAEEKQAQDAVDKETADKLVARVAELKTKPADQLTAEEKAELEAAEKAEEDDEDDPTAFWEDVDKLSGDPIEIKWDTYKDADGNLIMPDSPQGALIRQHAVEERAIQRFEEALAASDRRGYQYLLHRQAGGTDEQFFAQKTTALPPYETFKESIDLQTTFYKQHLIDSGLPEKQAKLVVDDAVKNKEIFELADKAYKEKDKAEQDQTKALQGEIERAQTQYNTQVATLDKLITTEAGSPGLKIIIPEAKKAPFLDFFRSLVTYDQDKKQFVLTQAITKEALPRLLESTYLLHIGGNIKDVVERTAATVVTRRLKRNVEKSKEPARSQADTVPRKKTLGEL